MAEQRAWQSRAEELLGRCTSVFAGVRSWRTPLPGEEADAAARALRDHWADLAPAGSPAEWPGEALAWFLR